MCIDQTATNLQTAWNVEASGCLLEVKAFLCSSRLVLLQRLETCHLSSPDGRLVLKVKA